NDGDLDIMCGEFLDKFTYFENTGSRTKPKYAAGRILKIREKPIKMDLEMIVPIAFDWDKDGDYDLVVGQEDGRVALVEHTGKMKNGTPQFAEPVFFKQKAEDVKFGALVTPWSCDWDDDGDEDLICGNTAGYIGFVENLDGGNPPRWAKPQYLEAEGEVIRIEAGFNGSIQGPCEAKWGYTTLSVADWDEDGLLDIIANSIWGKVVWFKNSGTKTQPKLAKAQPVQVQWKAMPPKPAWFWWNPEDIELATQWRTTPVAIDWNKDNLMDLVMLDHEGYLAFYERTRKKNERVLLPPKRIFSMDGPSGFGSRQNDIRDETPGLLRMNVRTAGGSGRRKFCFADWNMDGKLDVLVNSQNIHFLENISTNGKVVFKDRGNVAELILAGHTTSPTVVDWDKNGIPDLLIGAEDGFFYYLPNPNK
ncbi:MAG: VCBS repeat-containing protein, partial [Calditrichaeota bacterium]